MLDAGLVLYVGLLFLWLLRWLTWWNHRKTNLVYFNYAFLLYILSLVLLLYGLVLFVELALKDKGKKAWNDLPVWLRPMMIGAAFAGALVFLLVGIQMLQHVREIQEDRAISKHDRAVQIVALPVVYGACAMNSMARIFELFAVDRSTLLGAAISGIVNGKDVEIINASKNYTAQAEEISEMFLSKSETCFWVGDLYEAWALYQFAKLTLELIQASVSKMQHSQEPAERDKAIALMTAHSAVESIAWLGVMLFLVVCILQAGWSIYLLTFTGSHMQWSDYNRRVSQFGAAGMVASAGAIYNVHIVESTFHAYFETYRPLLKFITVKILVSFAFFQKGIFSVLQAFKSTLPGSAQRLANKVPLVGQILNFSEVQFQLFYDSLMLYECVLICLLHWWGWSATEDWYLDESVSGEAEDEEKRPLIPASGQRV